jgi:hypothetical protein
MYAPWAGFAWMTQPGSSCSDVDFNHKHLCLRANINPQGITLFFYIVACLSQIWDQFYESSAPNQIDAEPFRCGAEFYLAFIRHNLTTALSRPATKRFLDARNDPMPNGTSCVDCNPGLFLSMMIIGRLEGRFEFQDRLRTLVHPQMMWSAILAGIVWND